MVDAPSLPAGSLDDDTLADRYATPATPWLRANFVTSVDGAVEVGGGSTGLTGPQDQRVLRLLRRQCDALLVGAGTVRAENYGPLRLSEDSRRWRRQRRRPDDPTLVVVSGSLDLDPTAPVFAGSPVRPIVLTCARAPAARRASLAATAEVIAVGEDRVDLTAAVALLHRRGFPQILSEGGPHLLGYLTAADLVDEMCLTVSAILAGPGAGRITAGPVRSPPRRLTLRQVLTAGDCLLLRYCRPVPAG